MLEKRKGRTKVILLNVFNPYEISSTGVGLWISHASDNVFMDPGAARRQHARRTVNKEVSRGPGCDGR